MRWNDFAEADGSKERVMLLKLEKTVLATDFIYQKIREQQS